MFLSQFVSVEDELLFFRLTMKLPSQRVGEAAAGGDDIRDGLGAEACDQTQSAAGL